MLVEKTFINDIKAILSKARQKTYAYANAAMLDAYWQIGKRIVNQEQKGNKRADYGKSLIKELSIELTNQFGKGFDERELRRIRQFFLYFENWGAVRPELSWTHYRYLLRVEDASAREYYLNEAIHQSWNTRQLERNINSQYYQRILSNKKNNAVQNSQNNDSSFNASDLVKDPYMLEFLGIDQPENYSESELETAIINKLQHFLLELGKGYAFVARQYHIRTETKDFFIDLVFYNYILKCFVLIELLCAVPHKISYVA